MVVSIWLSTLLVGVLLPFVPADGESRIPMWADLYLRSPTDWEEIDFKLAYLMDTYHVVSLEKCLYEGSNDQNTVSMALTSKLSWLGSLKRKVPCRSMFATILWAVLLGMVTSSEVAKIPMWTDLGLGFGGLTDWEDLDFKLAFLMDTYDVVSLEKCLFRGSNDQNTVSVSAAKHS